MRVKKISVTRLFGLFDHPVPLNMRDRVTIMYGPNGYGKTTLLRLVHDLFCGKYQRVLRVPFRNLSVEFDDKSTLEVVRVDNPGPQKPQGGSGLTITHRRGSAEQHTTIPGFSPEALGIPPSYIERALPFLTREGSSQWLDDRTGEVLDLEDVTRHFPHILGPGSKLAAFHEPDWLGELRKKIPVQFIESQRLLRLSKPRAPHEQPESFRPSVVVYSSELVKLIKSKLAEYGTLSQSLDRSFPKRLVEQTRDQKSANKVPVSELKERLQERLQLLENKRNNLTKLGLLEPDTEGFDLASYLADPTLTQSVLPVYAATEEQKLGVFDDFAGKIELLRTIVNAHFSFKKLDISREQGFGFSTSYPGDQNRSRPISLMHLSSGEQHILVLLFELLFTVQPNSLILIDEPEISLHVAWQLEFLSDLQKITGLTNIDVVIATHAPGIINDRSDLTVTLEGPPETK